MAMTLQLRPLGLPSAGIACIHRRARTARRGPSDLAMSCDEGEGPPPAMMSRTFAGRPKHLRPPFGSCMPLSATWTHCGKVRGGRGMMPHCCEGAPRHRAGPRREEGGSLTSRGLALGNGPVDVMDPSPKCVACRLGLSSVTGLGREPISPASTSPQFVFPQDEGTITLALVRDTSRFLVCLVSRGRERVRGNGPRALSHAVVAPCA